MAIVTKSIDVSSAVKVADGPNAGLLMSKFLDGDDGYTPPSSQLPVGNFTNAKMALRIAYPRPDTETSTYAHHRNAYTGLRHEFPIEVIGGAWPVICSVVSGPAGLVVGEFLEASGDELVVDSDYCVVSWPSPTAGTHSVTLRVTDQQGATQDVSFDIVCGTSNHVFVDQAAVSSGDGTIGSPFKDIDDWYLSDDADSTYAGYKVWYRAGSYVVDNYDPANASLQLNENKPLVHVAYPGEAVTHDMGLSRYITSSTINACEDLYFGGITFDDTISQPYDNVHGFWITAANNRCTWFKCGFTNMGRGAVGNDNPSGVFFSVDIQQSNYICFHRCTMDSGTNTAPMYTLFGVDYFTSTFCNVGAFEIGTGNWQMLLVKSGCRYGSMRHNTTVTSATPQYGLIDLLSQADPVDQGDIELCYNTAIFDDDDIKALIANWTGSTPVIDLNFWFYRNTIRGRIDGLDKLYTLHVEDNVIVTDHASPYPADGVERTVLLSGNVVAATTDGAIDANGNLLSTYRTSNLGTAGSEIAS